MNIPALPSRPTKPARRFSTPIVAAFIVIVAAGAFLLGRHGSDSPSLSFTNEVRGSGVAAIQTRALPSFRAIDLAGTSTITVHVGEKQAVVVYAEDNLINHVKTDVRDGALVVSERGSFTNKLPLRVEVTMPDLDSARLLGSGTIRVDGVHARGFTADVSGSGLLAIAGRVDRLNARLAGSGNMQLRRTSPPTPSLPSCQDPAASRCTPDTRSTHRYVATGKLSTAATRKYSNNLYLALVQSCPLNKRPSGLSPSQNAGLSESRECRARPSPHLEFGRRWWSFSGRRGEDRRVFPGSPHGPTCRDPQPARQTRRPRPRPHCPGLRPRRLDRQPDDRAVPTRVIDRVASTTSEAGQPPSHRLGVLRVLCALRSTHQGGLS